MSQTSFSYTAPVERAQAWLAPQTIAVQDRRLCRVLEIIESKPSHSVYELAAEVRLSPTHLQRLFKRETGVHLSDVIAEHKLQKAAGLLCSGDMTTKEVAYAVGYGHHSSFVRAFQRRFAHSPSHFRLRSNAAAAS